MTGYVNEHVFPSESDAKAQFALLYATYGLRGRMSCVTKAGVEALFCEIVRTFPLFAVERGIREIINGGWPDHQGDHLPSFPVIWEAIRYQMWRQQQIDRGRCL